MTRVKEKNLTQKEEKAVKVFLERGDKTEAIKEAYDVGPGNTAKTMAQDVFNRPRVKQAVQEAMSKLGITPEQILKNFLKQTNKGKNEAAKVRANENLAQLADLYPDKHNEPQDNGGINIVLNY